MLQSNLPDPRVGRIELHRIGLPENVQKHILIGRVGGMLVGGPVGRVAVELHVPGESSPLRGGKGGPQKIWPGPVIPDARMMEGDFPAYTKKIITRIRLNALNAS